MTAPESVESMRERHERERIAIKASTNDDYIAKVGLVLRMAAEVDALAESWQSRAESMERERDQAYVRAAEVCEQLPGFVPPSNLGVCIPKASAIRAILALTKEPS